MAEKRSKTRCSVKLASKVLFVSTVISKLGLLIDGLGWRCALWNVLWHWPELFALDAATALMTHLCAQRIVCAWLISSAIWVAAAFVFLHAVCLKVFHVSVDFDIVLFIATHATIFLKNLPYASGQWLVLSAVTFVTLVPCVFIFRSLRLRSVALGIVSVVAVMQLRHHVLQSRKARLNAFCVLLLLLSLRLRSCVRQVSVATASYIATLSYIAKRPVRRYRKRVSVLPQTVPRSRGFGGFAAAWIASVGGLFFGPGTARRLLVASIATIAAQHVFASSFSNKACASTSDAEVGDLVYSASNWRANPLLRLIAGAIYWCTVTAAHCLGISFSEQLEVEVIIGSPTKPFNVVIVQLESVRASSIVQPMAAPFLSSWSRSDNNVYEMGNAHCTMPNTMKSMFSIHCGLPAAMGVSQKEYFAPRALRGCLPAALSRHGYKTAYFTSGSIGYQGRLGFKETFSGKEAEDLGRSASSSTKQLFERSHYLGLEEGVLLSAFDAWIDGHDLPDVAKQPFMITMGTTSTHAPYTVPRNWSKNQQWLSNETEYCRTCQRAKVDGAEWHSPSKCLWHCFLNSLNYVDEFIRDLIAILKKRDLLRNTVLVIVGDHGEHFAVDGASSFGHGSTINENDTHVPLIVRTPHPRGEASNKLLLDNKDTVISLAAVPSIVARAIGSSMRTKVHSGSNKHAATILRGQRVAPPAIVANLYGTLVGTLRKRSEDGVNDLCVRSTAYTKVFSSNCNMASRQRLEDYSTALEALYNNVYDTGGCSAGALNCSH